MKNTLKLAAACLALAGTTFLLAEESTPSTPPPPEHGRGPGGRGGPNLEELAERLGLTADQKAKIGPILKQQHEQMKTIRDDPSLTPDQKREKARAAREEGRKAIEPLLTPEQVKKLAEMREKGPRGGNRPPPEGRPEGN